jgi:hypothetical protein
MTMAVIQNIAEMSMKLGQQDICGIRLEDAGPDLLDVSKLDLDMHVIMQPNAIAYYGAVKKEASRQLSNLKKAYDRWSKKKYAEAKASLGAGTGKTTVADIEARFIVDNEIQIEDWERRIEEAQFDYDTMDSYLEAWRQKSFTIREYANLNNMENYNSNSSLSEEKARNTGSMTSSVSRVKSVIRQRHEEKLQG